MSLPTRVPGRPMSILGGDSGWGNPTLQRQSDARPTLVRPHNSH